MAILLVTQIWSPPNNEGGDYDPRPMGVWYTEVSQWSIFNQDRQSEMSHGAAFNVQALSQAGQ
jgi:hypothetical protein